jgi:Tfp pilus assembly protein PilZ
MPRSKMRIACTLHLEGSLHSGMVLDVSAGGLFVQTNASPAPGTPLRLELRVPGLSEPLDMAATVARKRIVPPRLRALLKGGIGIQLENAPEEFYAMIAKLQAADGASTEHAGSGQTAKAATASSKAPSKPSPQQAGDQQKPPRAKPKLTSFRVKLSQVGGSNSRGLVIRAADEDEARRRAILDVGDGWKVTRCEPK